MERDSVVNPYEVKGNIDYEAVAKRFGVNLIDEKFKERIRGLAGGDLHFMIRRGIYYAQRDMGWLLDEYEKGNKFYLYTGIAPSGAMTLGHLIPFQLTRWLQEKFDAEVYIQIPDEEKFLAKKKGLTLEKAHELSYDDAANIIAMGFDKRKTKIFLDTEYAKTLYKNAVRVSRGITFSMIKDAFGFTNEDNIGRIFYTSMQAVPAFLMSVEKGKNVPCLIPLAIDQDVHFRIARDSIAKLGYYKPASIQSKFLPALSGKPKMSASESSDTIYLEDDEETVRKKVYKAFTGQQPTAELQREHGGNPDICTVCQYYRFFFEPDDKKLKDIFDAERSGSLLAGEHKKDLTARINKYLKEQREKKEKALRVMDDFMVRD